MFPKVEDFNRATFGFLEFYEDPTFLCVMKYLWKVWQNVVPYSVFNHVMCPMFDNSTSGSRLFRVFSWIYGRFGLRFLRPVSYMRPGDAFSVREPKIGNVILPASFHNFMMIAFRHIHKLEQDLFIA